VSKRIRGITIQIGAETTGLDKALKDVNSKTRDINKELRDVNKLLKFNPKDTELLSQKQKLLGDQVEATKEKLDKLRAAQDEVRRQYQAGEIDEGRYRAFQREIIETESKLKHYESQLKEVNREKNIFSQRIEDASKKLKDIGSKMQDVGKQLSMKVTAPLTAIGAIAVKTGMDFEAAMSEVAAISGAAGEDLAKLEALAKKMGATTKFSASEAAEGLKYMAMAGWDTQQMLDGLPGVLSLAAASGEDLGRVSDIATDALTAFGMQASEAGEFADILAAASSNANTNVGMLGESFKYVAPVFGSLGYSAEDAALALGLMANAGIKASQAGTALRGAITRMMKPSKDAATAIDELGLKLTDAEGNMLPFRDVMDQLRSAFANLTAEQQAQYAATIFGQEAMSGMLAIINASEEDYTKLSDAINNSTGAAQQMAAEMQDNLQGRMTELKSAIEGVALEFYDAMQPALEAVIAAVKRFVGWLADLSPEMKTTITVIAALAAAIGPLLIALGMVANGIGAIIGILPVLKGAIAALTGPIGLVVAAIAAAIAIGVALWKNWDKIKEFAGKLWEGIKDIFAKIGKWISDTWNKAKEWTSNTWNNIKNTVSETAGRVRDGISSAFGSARDSIVGAWERVKENTSNAWNTIRSKVEEHGGGIRGVISTALEGYKNSWRQGWEAMNRLSGGKLGEMVSSIKSKMSDIRDRIANSKIGQAWSKIWDLKLPKIKLPKFSITGKFSLSPLQVPKISVVWNAQGALLDGATLFGNVGNTLLGGGEAGKEAVMPLEGRHMYPLADAIAKRLSSAIGGGQIIIQNMNVRDDTDIYLISRELFNLQRQAQLVGGNR